MEYPYKMSDRSERGDGSRVSFSVDWNSGVKIFCLESYQ